MKEQAAVSAIIQELKNIYPIAECTLPFNPEKAYELLFSVRLAAQCTDARVNMVTPVLYARFPTLQALAEASEEEIGEIIHSTGFWRAKARDIAAASRMLLEEYGGRVPDTMEDLLRLPGVGRKTANLILGDVYGKEGYVCDTHCIRITGLLGITDGSKDPLKVEKQLGSNYRAKAGLLMTGLCPLYPIISSRVRISKPSFFPFSLMVSPKDVVRMRPSRASATARDM